MARRPVVGAVAEFDPDRGLGTVAADDGRALPFHCTAIADGSRQIDPGTRVTFLVVPGHLGRLEARGLTPVASRWGLPPDPGEPGEVAVE